MSLTYNGTTIGTITIEQEHNKTKHRYELQIRQGNVRFGVVIYERPMTEEEKKGAEPGATVMHTLMSFWADEQHLKNMIKSSASIMPGYKVVRAELNMHYKENYTLLKYMMLSGFKVVCYNKVPKAKKGQ